MHWLRKTLDIFITGKSSMISISLSVVLFAVAAFTGAKDDDFPLFYFLVIIGALLFIIQVLVQIIEEKNQKIDEDGRQLSSQFITAPKNNSGSHLMTGNSMAIKFNKLDADIMGFCELEIILNTKKKINSKVDLVLICHENLDLQNKNAEVKGQPFQKYFHYHLVDVFTPVSAFFYTASLKIRLPKSSISPTSIRLKIGYDLVETEQDFTV